MEPGRQEDHIAFSEPSAANHTGVYMDVRPNMLLTHPLDAEGLRNEQPICGGQPTAV